MNRILKLKPVVNKRNGQINFSLPKKKISEELSKNIMNVKSIKFRLEGWE